MPKGDFYNTLNVLAQPKTEPRSLLRPTTNATVQTSAQNKYATATRPASGTGSLVIQTEGMSYMRIIPFFQNTGSVTVTSPSMRVIGWSYSVADALFVPHLLCDVAVTLTTQDVTVNSVSMRQALAISKTYGDAKIYSSSASPAAGVGMLVDTLGCQAIEFAFAAASVANAPVATAYYSSM
jgi:hypothetical protein